MTSLKAKSQTAVVLLIIFILTFSIFRPQARAEENGQPTENVLVKPTPSSDATSGGNENAEPAKGTPPSEVMSESNKVARLATPATDALTEKMLTSLVKQAGWFPQLKVSVQEGMVTIRGKTKDITHLEWLARTADRLPNVVAVINQAEIETPPVSDFTPVANEFKVLLEKSKKALPRLAMAIVILLLFSFLGLRISKVVHRLWGRSITNMFLHGTVSKLTMLPVWIFIFYLTLQVAGLQNLATTIIGGTGAVGLILGFAFKDIMSNYLSGILLAIRSPFTKGDEIQIADYQGFIQSLNMRGTTIIDYDGNLILIPNATVTQSVIINKTITKKKRVVFFVGISYRDSAPRAIQIIEEILRTFPDIIPDPKPLVIADKFSELSIDIKVVFWYDAVKSSGDKIKSTALGLIREKLLAEKFSLPGSLRPLLFTEGKDTQPDQKIDPTAVSDLTDHSSNHENELKRLGQGVDIMRKPNDNLVTHGL